MPVSAWIRLRLREENGKKYGNKKEIILCQEKKLGIILGEAKYRAVPRTSNTGLEAKINKEIRPKAEY